jgi:hypothetical protein
MDTGKPRQGNGLNGPIKKKFDIGRGQARLRLRPVGQCAIFEIKVSGVSDSRTFRSEWGLFLFAPR